MAIREPKELSTLSVEQLLDSLLTHEMELAVFDNDDKKKNIALKTSHEKDEESESDEDDEMAMITRESKGFWKSTRTSQEELQKIMTQRRNVLYASNAKSLVTSRLIAHC